MFLSALYSYFSRFVPTEVLEKNYIPDLMRQPDEADILQAEVMNMAGERISSISDYLFLGDQDFVLERLRNSHGQLLMLDSDRLDYQPDHDEGSRLSVGLTVAEHYNQSNSSVVRELVIQERCLETLKRILRSVVEDAEVGRCPAGFRVSLPIEIRFFDLKALNGLIGYTAFFSIITSEYRN